jgi:putative hydroxymethylpyrimidine transport system substrate-binding protein
LKNHARTTWLVPAAALFLASAILGGCAAPQPQQPTAAAAGTSGPQQPPTQVSVALDWYPWSNHMGLYEAQDSGYYQDVGLDTKVYVPSNPEDVLKLVASGKDTFGISYESDVLLARSEGIPVKSIAAMVRRPLNTLMTLKSSGITRPKQLEGKKVGYPGIPGHEALLATMLEKDGSSIDKVELVNVGYDLVPALIGKKVDAIIGGYAVHEAILAEEQGYPVNVMPVTDWGVPNFYELVMVTSDKTAAEQPDMVKRFMWATAKGYSKAVEDPTQALALLAKANPEADMKMEAQGSKILMPLWMDNTSVYGWQDKNSWQNLANWMKSRKLLTQDVDVDAAYTNDFLTK